MTIDKWFLPNREQLNQMYHQLHLKGLGGFASNNYWSSSQRHNKAAWFQDFDYGGQDYNDTNTRLRVRAVRAVNENFTGLKFAHEGKWYEVSEEDEAMSWHEAMEEYGTEDSLTSDAKDELILELKCYVMDQADYLWTIGESWGADLSIDLLRKIKDVGY